MRKLLFLLVMITCAATIQAAESFIFFQPTADCLPLSGATVGFDSREATCVQRAVSSLQADMERVTGKQLTANSQQPIPELCRVL